jgi:hypothetical protein
MKSLGMIFAAWLVLAAPALAQGGPPKAGPEHKKLDMFAGTWTLEGEIKPGPMGAGGKLTEDEKCEWMDGGFYLVCHVNFRSAFMGNGEGLAVMGYSSDDKTYTYREFNSFGEFEDAKGSVDGDTWTWTSDERMGNSTVKGRFTMKITSATSYTVMYELSQDGKAWNTVMDGKATKAK